MTKSLWDDPADEAFELSDSRQWRYHGNTWSSDNGPGWPSVTLPEDDDEELIDEEDEE
jgi:hypothetical protein